MAHFFIPPTAKSTGYDVDNKLAPGSVWRMQVLVNGSRKVGLSGGTGLRIRSNNDGVVPTSEIMEFPFAGVDRLIRIPGETLGTSLLEVGEGGDDKKNEPIKVVWILLQVQVTEVTIEMLRAIMPRARAAANIYLEPLNRAMADVGIDTPERRAAFLAQISVESNQLQDTVENLNYTAQRLRVVWPGRFPTVAAAAPFAHNPEALGNHVYANRLGNGNEASGDGFRFRGRGLMQVTGRANYRDVGFENNPEALSNPVNAANTAAAFWLHHGLNERTTDVLNRTLFDAVSRTVNGGNVGQQDRWNTYERALSALGLDP